MIGKKVIVVFISIYTHNISDTLPLCPLCPLWFNHSDAVRESMAECPLPSLLQNRACDFHRTRLLSDVILVMDTVRSHNDLISTA